MKTVDFVNINIQPSEEFIPTPKKHIIVLDSDECVGSWGDLSLIYNLFQIEFKHELENIDTFMNIIITTGCIRPFLRELFNHITELKKNGAVHKVYMCTAASNKAGWVNYLVSIIEKWYGCKIYDEIIHREHIEEWSKKNKVPFSNSIGYIKDMNMIKEVIKKEHPDEHFEIIAIDDRPQNILNGISLGVKPYLVAVNLIEVVRMFYPDKFDFILENYGECLNNVWTDFLKNKHKYTNTYNDIELLKIIEQLPSKGF
jgi:hypothetical protein